MFVSFKTLKAVTSCSIAIWPKIVLINSGIDISKFKAHSCRSASSSAALNAGMSLKDILKMANWASAQTFKNFYYRNVEKKKNKSHYVNSVIILICSLTVQDDRKWRNQIRSADIQLIYVRSIVDVCDTVGYVGWRN